MHARVCEIEKRYMKEKHSKLHGDRGSLSSLKKEGRTHGKWKAENLREVVIYWETLGCTAKDFQGKSRAVSKRVCLFRHRGKYIDKLLGVLKYYLHFYKPRNWGKKKKLRVTYFQRCTLVTKMLLRKQGFIQSQTH